MRIAAVPPNRFVDWPRRERRPEEDQGLAAAGAPQPVPPPAAVEPAQGEAEGELAGAEEAAEALPPGQPRAPHQLTDEQEAEVSRLQRRDAEVRAHEMAHAAAAGSAGGGASYTYETGPDGRQYAVGGEVPVQIDGGQTPEEAIRNAARVRAAALAPAEPSAQDRAVAAEAAAMEAAARAELAARTRATSKASATGAPRRPTETKPGEPESPAGAVADSAAPAQASAMSPFDPAETMRQLEQEQSVSRGQWRHRHLSSGCGSCSAAVASYR